jgi:hypothetical protein
MKWQSILICLVCSQIQKVDIRKRQYLNGCEGYWEECREGDVALKNAENESSKTIGVVQNLSSDTMLKLWLYYIIKVKIVERGLYYTIIWVQF